jgi:hypothetical protein
MQNKMPVLNLPAGPVSLKTENGRRMIFDFIRKKYLVLTPEEWVRQHFLHYITAHLGYPASLIHLEASIGLNRLRKRCDAIVYSKKIIPLAILEFKAPDIEISMPAFEQAARYNMTVGVRYLILSNGMEHFCCKVDRETGTYAFLNSIPGYDEL